MENSYFDFDLAVELTEDGDFVRVLAAPAGEAVAPFRNPFTRRELDDWRRLLAAPGDEGLRGVERQNAIRQFGERLHRAIFTDNIRLCWDESLRLAYQQRLRLRLRLLLQTAAELIDLPWEYLFDPQRREFLALGPNTPLVRYIDLKQPIVPLKVATPLRMLVVVANPGGRPRFDDDESWLAMVDTLDYLAAEGKLVLERLLNPTLHELQRRLRSNHYHLFHFIGHGTYQRLSEDFHLLFEDEMGRPRPVNSQHLGALLHDHFPFRLATFQACSTAEVSEHNPYLGVAQQMLRRGLPASLAILQPLESSTSLAFLSAFYQAVASYIPVDQAITEARRALWSTEQHPAWGAMALFLRVADGRLFAAPPVTNEPPRRPRFALRRLSG
jgi:hypothetical protein